MSKVTLPTATLGAERAQGSYLFVFDDGGSRRIALTKAASWVIGRSEECDVHLLDASASRRHARIDATDDEFVLVDLESRHGTRVNDAIARGRTRLSSGDVIQIGRSSIVAHISPSLSAIADALEPADVHRRLSREVERARRHRRSLAVVLVMVSGSALAITLEDLRRRLDADGSYGRLNDESLLVILPEANAQQAEDLARELVGSSTGRARAACAMCPGDAASAEGLISAARGRVRGEGERLEIGRREVIVADPAMAKTYELVRRLSASEMPVLVLGESGTGKEMIAYALHEWSSRSKSPFVALNCAAIPETLVESELFGHEKGAFTGADRAKAGLIESAAGGTLFLDEIAELPAGTQAKLLRALEERAVLRVGGRQTIAVDFRLVAATNRDVAAEVAGGRLREDLYYRIAAAILELPPLRARPRDLATLARVFLERASQRAGGRPRRFSEDALHVLGSYRFPGNVRELRNAIEYACTTTSDDVIEPWHLPAAIAQAPALPTASAPRAFRPIDEEIAEVESRRMREALEAAGGKQGRAADLIGMPRRTFVTKVAKYGLRNFGAPDSADSAQHRLALDKTSGS